MAQRLQDTFDDVARVITSTGIRASHLRLEVTESVLAEDDGRLIELGRALGLLVVAEGVETETQLDALSVPDCDLAQGYLFARPMPPAEVPGHLAALAASSATR